MLYIGCIIIILCFIIETGDWPDYLFTHSLYTKSLNSTVPNLMSLSAEHQCTNQSPVVPVRSPNKWESCIKKDMQHKIYARSKTRSAMAMLNWSTQKDSPL